MGPRDRALTASGQRPEGPELARDFKPAEVDPAALPVRVLKVAAGEGVRYVIQGILWGPRIPRGALRIQVDPTQGFVPVEKVDESDGRSWVFWSHRLELSRPKVIGYSTLSRSTG